MMAITKFEKQLFVSKGEQIARSQMHMQTASNQYEPDTLHHALASSESFHNIYFITLNHRSAAGDVFFPTKGIFDVLLLVITK